MYTDIAIIGVSGLFPKSNTLEKFHNNLKDAKDCISSISNSRINLLNLEKNKEYMKLGYIDDIECFDNMFFNISNKEADFMSPEQRLSLELVANTILDAGYSLESFKGVNCAVIASCTDNEYESLLKETSSLAYIGSLKSMLTGKISYYFNLHGPNIVIDTGCSSTLVCIHEACKKLSTKEVDYSLVGGISIFLNIPEGENGTNNNILNIESSDGRCKPFDNNADGTGLGEGGGYILLKRLDDAIADKNNIYGVIKSSYINGDGIRCSSVTTPSIEGQKEAIINAWLKGGINPEDITEIEAHGTGTKLGDPIEVTSLTESFQYFNKSQSEVHLGSVKSNIGHLGFAAGIASIIKVLMEFKYNYIYPLTNFKTPNSLINFDKSPLKPVTKLKNIDESQKRVVGINSFGFSGTNAHIVIENYVNIIKNSDIFENKLVKISAKTEESFYSYLQEIKSYLEKNKVDLNDAIYTLNIGRDDYKYRRLLHVDNLDDLVEQLDMITPAKVKKDMKVVLILTNSIETDFNYNLFCKKYSLFKYFCNIIDKGDYSYKIAMYKFLLSLGVKPDYVIADDYGKAVVEFCKGDISIDKLNSLNKLNENTEIDKSSFLNIKKQIEKLSEKNDLLVINLSSLSNNEYLINDSVSWFMLSKIKDFEKFLISFYNNGFNICWNNYYYNSDYKRISLPTYCFEKTRHWHQKANLKTKEKKSEEINNYNEQVENTSNYKDIVDIQNNLIDIWKNVLDFEDEFNIDDDFFDFGGNSLLITMLVEDIFDRMNVKIDVSEIYEYTTIGEQSDLIKSRLVACKYKEKEKKDDIKQSSGNCNLPLTSMQKTILYSQKNYPNKSSWNLSIALRIEGHIDQDKLKKSIERLVEKHEVLRSKIIFFEQEAFFQVGSEDIDFNIVKIGDEYQSIEQKEILAREMLRKESLTPIDLFENLLMKTFLYKISENINYLLINIHHIIADGWSLSILFKELFEFYSNPELKISHSLSQFSEFSLYEKDTFNSKKGIEQLNFWKKEFEGFKYKFELPLKTDKPHNSIVDVEFMIIDKKTTENLREFTKQQKVSVFHVLLMTYHLTIMKKFNICDSCIGMMVANRNIKNFNNTIGLLARVLPSRIIVDKKEGIKDVLNRIKIKSGAALDNQMCSINEIMNNDINSKNITFDELIKFFIVYQNFGNINTNVEELKFSTGIVNQREAFCPLGLIIYENSEVVVSSIEYDPCYFDKKDINEFIKSYKNILNQIITENSNFIDDIF